MKKNADIDEVLKKELNELKSYLPEGWAKTVATNLNVSESTVRHAKAGRFKNKRVMLELIKLAKDEQKDIQQVLEPSKS